MHVSYLLCAGEKSVKGTSLAQHLVILGGFCSKDWHSSACFHQRKEVTWFEVFCLIAFPSGTWGKGGDSVAENEPAAAIAFRRERFHVPTFCDENLCHKINW